MRELVVILFLLFSFNIKAGETAQITFQRIDSDRTIHFDLPLNCVLYEKCGEKKTGILERVDQNEISFSYFHIDTAEVNHIYEMDVKRSVRDLMLDSLIRESKYFSKVSFEQIDRISILSNESNLLQQVASLFATAITFGSACSFMSDVSTHVGTELPGVNWLKLAGVGVGVSGMIFLQKQNIKMNKWRILSSDLQ